jgi:molybdopterin-guanine dinucleotide biosynthesis protein
MAILGVLVVNGFVLALAIAYSLRGDLRLVEGFKREPFPKIELRRDGSASRQPLTGVPEIIAIASDP